MLHYIRPQDIADIIIMSFVVYQLYSWFKNTKAMQVVFGLGLLGVIYVVTKNLGLFMTSWILQELGTVLFVLLVVIFQAEILQTLYRFSLLRNLFDRQESGVRLDLMELASTFFRLAAQRTGAIIVFQRKEPLDEYLLHGVPVDGVVSAQLIGSIFFDGTPLHDGAIIVRDGRITQASCHLPLSSRTDLPQFYGTRHRAGLGLTERSDAVAVVVSEERGEVSLALGSDLRRIDTPEILSRRLSELLVPAPSERPRISWRERLFSNLRPKLVSVFLVVVCWILVTARQGGILTVTAPIKYHNIPGGLVLTRATPEEVEVQLKFISSLIPSPKNLDIVADLDLSDLREGGNTLALKSSDFQVPTGIMVTSINPSMVRVVAERKIRKTLRVRVKLVGTLPRGQRLRRIVVEPATVAVEGPASLLAKLDEVPTEELSLGTVRQSSVFEKRIVSPSSQIRVLRDEPARIRVVTSSQ